MKRFAIAVALLAIALVAPSAQSLAQTYCSTNADCPSGQLCCYPCGRIGCQNECMAPVRGRCPLFP